MPDPNRYIFAHLADPGHKLPFPRSARLFSASDEGEQIDSYDPFWIQLLADGSVKAGPRPVVAFDPEPSPEADRDIALSHE